ncbi:type 1 glutamine amidotransferase domain-containing protein [Pseudoxanthomonas daejeonensis]|uniref:Type 1 glutamine amidotransferase domain-containing protein n=1 Tax=Pseudoxanthomonas daejeonensis TaxID=266062 RepID=A0ABQ6Z892_9GAMM|nr:type 1 glutamine amidotransferase domain-containing protein [Pseudoxanthomonas daejeonensis]KAF1695095.1 type 1 glutamine amidotransferase domain-containing protein [Pseudoxanthomonas daejeonensis]
MWKWGKRVLVAFLGLVIVLAAVGGLWWQALDLGSQPLADPGSTAAQLDFLKSPSPPRGKVLAVVTSTASLGDSGKRGGYELTELSRAYYTFLANGYEVDIASPQGGEPPMRTDDDMVAADYAFLNDPQARRKLATTLKLAEVDSSKYAAVYFVGGKGTMFDFPDDPSIPHIVRDIYRSGGVVGAVCHGPAALLQVVLDDGTPLLRGRRATGFTNAEELFLIKDARTVFPFLLQERMQQAGARFVEGPMYLENTVVDGRLVTGQNPWSTWSVAEAMVQGLGHAPVARARSGEELSVQVLDTYRREGIDAALRLRRQLPDADRRLLLMHALVAAMQGGVVDAWHLQRLARG